MALIRALAKLQELNKTDADIHMVLDSQYVLNAITKHWISGWKRRGWKRRGWKRSAGDLANAELWQELDGLLNRFSNLSYAWTKGHATNDGNLFVDDLLNESMDEMKAGHALKPSHESVVKGQKPIAPAKPVVPTRKSTSQKAASKPQTEKPLSNDVKKNLYQILRRLWGNLTCLKICNESRRKDRRQNFWNERFYQRPFIVLCQRISDSYLPFQEGLIAVCRFSKALVDFFTPEAA